MEVGEMLQIESRDDFDRWLAAHGAEKREVWTVIYKKASGKQTVTYRELVEAGIAHGWVDSQTKGVDEARYAIRFSPRRTKSHWTEANLAIARRLISEGKMTEAGQAAMPAEGIED